ncbi:MAG: DNA alkylation repair protein [Bacteroidota bacterium]
MPEALKNQFFTKGSIQKFANEICKEYASFDNEKFLELIYTKDWETKELKAKMYHVTNCLHDTFSKDYLSALEILLKIAPFIKGFEAMVLPDFVEQYGLDFWDESLAALKEFTKYSSSEFAIRPFIIANVEKSMSFMLKMATDSHENVRRFASEGCRPRLPWAMALPNLKKDPSLIFPILEKLKNDESEFVRRSVANNLNDISKDNPDMVLNLCEKWIGNTKNTDWIVKHACRSLLKEGNSKAMRIFGFGDPKEIEVKGLKTDSSKVKIGTDLQFEFQLINQSVNDAKIRLEYRVYFMKANGKQSGKIFQISEKLYKPGEYTIKKKHSFKNLSTRKHYTGDHGIGIVVNGVEKGNVVFQVSE